MQLEVETEQVRQIESHRSQVLVALLAIVVPAGQVGVQVTLSRKNPEAQVMQAVWLVHVAQGLTQTTQRAGSLLVRGYIPPVCERSRTRDAGTSET